MRSLVITSRNRFLESDLGLISMYFCYAFAKAFLESAGGHFGKMEVSYGVMMVFSGHLASSLFLGKIPIGNLELLIQGDCLTVILGNKSTTVSLEKVRIEKNDDSSHLLKYDDKKVKIKHKDVPLVVLDKLIHDLSLN